jgi:hypothetical protein
VLLIRQKLSRHKKIVTHLKVFSIIEVADGTRPKAHGEDSSPIIGQRFMFNN